MRKKLLSIVLVLCMILPNLPAFAAGTETDTSVYTAYIINHDFDDDADLNAWRKGAVTDNETAFSLDRVTLDDGGNTTALALSATKIKRGNYNGSQPTAFLDLGENKINFTAGNKIIIETKFKQVGSSEGNAWAYLKLNRPYQPDFASVTTNNVAEDESHWWTLLRMEPTKLYNWSTSAGWTSDFVGNINTTNNWTEVKIVIDASTKQYTITTKTGDVEGTVSDRLYGDPNAIKLWNSDKTSYDSLDYLTFYLRQYAQEIYVDYFRVMEQRPFITASATLTKNFINTNESVKLTFTNDIVSLPEGAVYIDGVESDVSYDKTTKTATIQPKNPFVPGAHHTVKVDSALLAEKAGVTYSGETEFAFDVSDVSATVTATGNVITGTVITSTYNYTSSKPQGTHLYQWQVSVTGEEGTFTDITENAATKDFTVTESEYGKYLRLKMIPCGLDNGTPLYGAEAYSNIIIPEKKPVASDVEIIAEKLYPGITIYADYDFTDENGDDEGTSVIKWFTSDSSDGGWSQVHTGETYTIRLADVGKHISCTVTPYAISDYEYEGDETEYCTAVGPVSEPMFNDYIINHDFDDDADLERWVKGAVRDENQTVFSLNRVTLEDDSNTTALEFSATKIPAGNINGTHPTAFLDLGDDKIKFTPGNKIYIEARFKVKGDDSGNVFSYLKFNRPNSTAFTNISDTVFEDSNDVWTMLRITPNTLFNWNYNNGYGTAPFASEVDTVNNWTDVKIVIDEGTKKYSIESKTGNVTGSVQNIPFSADRQAISLWNPDKTEFDSLDYLTFYFRQYAQTLYVDYFRVYEERSYINTSATLDSDYIRTTDPLTLTFDGNVSSVPEGALYIEGVDTDVTYDRASKKATIQPKSELAPGAHHTIKVNTEIFASAGGVNYRGETEFAFSVADVSVNTLIASGKNIIGNVITSSYKYSSSKPEGTHQYQWQVSANGEEGTFTDIVGATEPNFTVTSNEYGKYLRFKMIPYGKDAEGNSTIYGFESYSNVLIPEKKPVASNVSVSTSVLFPGIYISSAYDYSDENGDDEGESVIKWYTSDSESGSWTEVYTGAVYYIESTDINKYIKCTVAPVALSEVETTGDAVSSEAVGPVSDLMASTNLYTDPGFEAGVLGDWKYINVSGKWEGIKIQTKDVYEGNYALELTSRQSQSESYGQDIPLSADKTYVVGFWAKKINPKLQDVTSFSAYCSTENALRCDPEGKFQYSLTDKWSLIVNSYKPTASANVRFSPVSFVAQESGLEQAYLDNFYLSELVIADIETYEQQPITIPENGSTSVTVTSGKVLNQLGTQHGLWNETVKIRIPETKGVYVDEEDKNKIIVTDEAVKSKLIVEVYCEPSYSGAAQSIFQKFIELDIVPHNDPKPRITSIDVSGNVAAGSTLTGEYTFYQVENKADASEIRWMYSDSEDGDYYDIPGANSLTYTVAPEYAEKYIKMAVVPKTSDGLVGTEVRSAFLTKPRVPVSKDVAINGKFNVGSTVTVSYKFDDPNRDNEGVSTFKWYVSDSANGIYSAIPGATANSLTLTEDLIDKYIKVGVVPVSSVAPTTGVEVFSEAYAGPVAPVAINVSITRDETRLIGNYDFYHKYGALETDTVFLWTVDGKVVSNTIAYVIDFTGTKTVTFTVTPVADSNPSKGTPVSVSVVIKGNSGIVGGNTSSGGGGFGGGGGGSSSGSGNFTSGVVSVNGMVLGTTEENKEQNTEQKTEQASDIKGHWGEEYIGEMVSRGVMKSDENGKYNPDELVTRERMITYLFKTLGLETSEYIGTFNDIEKGEFANMLQTMVDNGTIAVDTSFRPDDSISREEMCKILYISLVNAGKLEKTDEMLIKEFEDFNSISDWAKVYVNGIYASKIMIGVSDTHFAPRENLTKAQAATLLTRIIKLIEGGI